jgi:hypothetical protein
MASDLSSLKDEIKALRTEVGRLRGKCLSCPFSCVTAREANESNADESEIRKLHHKYGYYLDKCLYQEVRKKFKRVEEAYPNFAGR